ncbi:helix-turn-helix domain-containing protein [Fictibacillus sp. Mic-4]|uniref:helix-turn-helix domain-containing protein n=1 Tax=Fictibacillus sp. Mic-4 TaxID=3132826 RepID=UPI003CF5096C
MSDLGNFLKQKREEKGLSLEELQTITKIQKRYLQAIEEGRYDVLPGSFYARAFIKNYCEAVHLNYEEVFEEYENDLPKSVKEVTEYTPRSEKTRQVETKDAIFIRFLPSVVIVVVVLALFLGIWKLYQHFSAADHVEQKNPETGIEMEKDKKAKEADRLKKQKEEEAAKVNKEKEKAKKDADKPKGTLSKISTVGNRTTYELKNTDQFKAEVTMRDDAYIGIKGDGAFIVNTTIKKGDKVKRDLSDKKEVDFNIAKSHMTDLKINGQPITYPVEPSSMMHQHIIIKFTKSTQP